MTEKTFSGRAFARVLVAPTAVALAVTLAGCMPGGGGNTPAASNTVSTSASPSDSSIAPSDSPSASASEAPAPAPSLSASDIQNIQESISSGNTAALVGYLSNPVHVAAAASDLIEDVSPDVAVEDIGFITSGTGWSWNVPASTIATWRASAYYGTWFPDGAIIGLASSGQVVSFVVTGDHITTIYVAGDVSVLTDA